MRMLGFLFQNNVASHEEEKGDNPITNWKMTRFIESYQSSGANGNSQTQSEVLFEVDCLNTKERTNR